MRATEILYQPMTAMNTPERDWNRRECPKKIDVYEETCYPKLKFIVCIMSKADKEHITFKVVKND